jgi:hypothetical protein
MDRCGLGVTGGDIEKHRVLFLFFFEKKNQKTFAKKLLDDLASAWALRARDCVSS